MLPRKVAKRCKRGVLVLRLDRALPANLREVILVAGGTMLVIEIEKR